MIRVAVIGAGVNGVCSAIKLAEAGHSVSVFDKSIPFSETSSKSSRMFHGGIRYLEQGHFKLVREALVERKEWLEFAPEATEIKRFFIPIFKNQSRSRLVLYLGVKFYQWLAGAMSLGNSSYCDKAETLKKLPELKSEDLLGAVSYLDVVFDHKKVSTLLIDRLISKNASLHENAPIKKISKAGVVVFEDDTEKRYDAIVNAAGPWIDGVLKQSSIDSQYALDLVRGSHLIIDYSINNAIVFQVQEEKRIIFMIPIGDKSLLGTTEVLQKNSDEVFCSEAEVDYLLSTANHFLEIPVSRELVIESFAGLRPIIKRKFSNDFSKASRDAQIEVTGKVINVFGGKWTSARSLAEKVFGKCNLMVKG